MNHLNPDEFRVPPDYVLDKSDQYYVQPALFDEYGGGEERYAVSEAARGLTAMGTLPGWNSMGRQYINGKRVVTEDVDGSV
jgi:hypothetical protein